MSEDEGETQGSLTLYRVDNLPWRSSGVTKLLRVLDALWRRERGGTRCARPHLRYIADMDSPEERGPPKELPRNAIDDDWLDQQPDLQKHDLYIQPAFDSSLPLDLLR